MAGKRQAAAKIEASNTASDDAVRIRYEVDKYNTDFMRCFWNERREEIMQSGNPVRIRLLNEHDDRERNRQ